jgi:hypothetical protein
VAPNTTTQAGWDNHFAAFAEQDVEKILLDYTEDSEINIYDWTTKEESVHTGLDAIGTMFGGLFTALHDTTTLAAPVVMVEHKPIPQVFLVWETPSSGFLKVTDSFLFDDAGKIIRQNIVVQSAVQTTTVATASGSGSEPETTEAAATTLPTTASPTEAGVTYREAQTFSTQIDAGLAAAILALGDDDKAAAIKQLAEHALAKTELTYDDVESADLVESVVVRQRRAKTYTLEVVFKSSVTAEKAATAVTAFNAAVTAGDFNLTITVGGTEFTYTPGAATGGTKQVKEADTSSATTAFVSASSVLVAGLVAVAL